MPDGVHTATHNWRKTLRWGGTLLVSSGEIVFILGNRLSEAEDPRQLGNLIIRGVAASQIPAEHYFECSVRDAQIARDCRDMQSAFDAALPLHFLPALNSDAT